MEHLDMFFFFLKLNHCDSKAELIMLISVVSLQIPYLSSVLGMDLVLEVNASAKAGLNSFRKIYGSERIWS